jgi:hypothetical protein
MWVAIKTLPPVRSTLSILRSAKGILIQEDEPMELFSKRIMKVAFLPLFISQDTRQRCDSSKGIIVHLMPMRQDYGPRT